MKNKDFGYITNLDKKQANRNLPVIVPSICCWSDLLGFGSVFTSNNWELSSLDWSKTIRRLIRSQDLCMKHCDPIHEQCLSLNDGIVRSFLVESHVEHIQTIAEWVRHCIFYHMLINCLERQENLPGLRTIMAAGHRAIHNFENTTRDDYVLNYTKPDPNKISDLCRFYDPVVFHNPSAFQMNTAFSKCFIIDEAGTKAKISGPNFYIDNSAIDFIIEASRFYSNICATPIFRENKGFHLFAIPKKGNEEHFHIGFELTGPIEFEEPLRKLKTTIWKVDSFYCWDEDPKEFKITLKEDIPGRYDLIPDSQSVNIIKLDNILEEARQIQLRVRPLKK